MMTRRLLLMTATCCLLAIAWWSFGADRGSSTVPAEADDSLTSLAVLPFAGAPSSTVSQRALGVGVADLITLRLQQLPGVGVSPFSRVLQLPLEVRSDPRLAGERLGVKAVLSGECRVENDRATLQVVLTDVATGTLLWGHKVSASARDPVETERALTEGLLQVLSVGAPTRRPVATPLAHYLCVLARGKVSTLRSDATEQALSLLERALEEDPDLAEIHTELAAASVDEFLGGQSSSPAWTARAVAAARRGVRLSPSSARAHFVLGRALLAGGEPVEATGSTLQAIRLDPDLAMAHMQLAGILCGIGPTAHARAAVERARRLDPAAADGWVDSYLAEIDGRVEEQIAVLRQQFERRRAAHASLEQPAMLLAYLNATAGHSSEALSWLATLEGITRNDPLVDLIRLKVMAAMGQKRAVQRLLEGHRAFYERDWQYSLVVAEAFARLGNPEEALWWIQRAVELGSMDLWGIERIPGLTSLQGDPRLDAATRRVRERVDAVMELVRRAGDA